MPLGHAVDERVVAACARDRRAVERRLLALTALGGIAAARMEQATARPIELARHDAGDRRQALGGSPLRQGGQQGGRVGVVWISEEARQEEHKAELPSLMRLPYSVFCLKKKHN